MVKPASVQYIKTQTERVQRLNAKLAQEDKALAAQEKAEEMRVIAMKKAHQEAVERMQAEAELKQNAMLKLENARLKEQMLESRLAAKRARIGEMKAKVKAGDFHFKGFHLKARGLKAKRAKAGARPARASKRGSTPLHALHKGKVKVKTPFGVRFVSKDPFVLKHRNSLADAKVPLTKVTSPLGVEWEGKRPSALPEVRTRSPLRWLAAAPAVSRRRHVKEPTQKLVGKYVKACEKGRGCHMVYQPESVEHWDAANHTEKVMESGLGVPIGPVRRVPISGLQNPLRDTARPEPDHSIYGVFTGSFFGPSDKEFSDNFVPIGGLCNEGGREGGREREREREKETEKEKEREWEI